MLLSCSLQQVLSDDCINLVPLVTSVRYIGS